MTKRKKEPPKHPSGNLDLVFGAGPHVDVVVSGVFGLVPMTAWLAPLLMPLGSRTQNGVLMGTVGIGFMLSVFVLPWLVPLRVLRARQPRGARITWDGESIVEWDGAWRRAVVPWNGMQAARFTWKNRGRALRERIALQVVDPATQTSITVWNECPDEAPVVRRRLESDRTTELEAAIEEHGILFTRTIDWSRIRDPDRARPKLNVYLGRFGYVAGFLAPLIAGPSRSLGIAIGIVGAALLTLRALPVLAEVRAIRSRLADAPTTEDPVGRTQADRDMLRAARAELVVRLGCGVLLVAATLVSAFVVPWDGPAPRT